MRDKIERLLLWTLAIGAATMLYVAFVVLVGGAISVVTGSTLRAALFGWLGSVFGMVVLATGCGAVWWSIAALRARRLRRETELAQIGGSTARVVRR